MMACLSAFDFRRHTICDRLTIYQTSCLAQPPHRHGANLSQISQHFIKTYTFPTEFSDRDSFRKSCAPHTDST